MNVGKMMKDLQRAREDLEKRLAEMRIEGSAGGGLVKAVVDGQKQLHSVAFGSGAVDPNDLEMLQDLVVAAVNDAGRRADEESKALMNRLMGPLSGGMNISGLF